MSSSSRPAAAVLGLLAAGLVVLAFLHPGFRDAEGALSGRVCLVFGVAAALALLAGGLARGLALFGWWLAVAMVGQAVALQLIDAGRPLRYQHYASLDRLLMGGNALLAGAVAVQAALVGWGLRGRWGAVRDWLKGHLTLWQLWLVGNAFVLSSAVVSADVPRYVLELGLAAAIQLISVGAVILAVWSIPDATRLALGARLSELLDGTAPRIDRFALGVALWIVGLSAALAALSYGHHPHLADEVAYLYQARYFADGVLTLPRPAAWEAFEFYLVQPHGDRWYASAPPGWPAVLAVGVLLGVPWLVNPLLAGSNVLLSHALLRDLYDPRVARVGVFLLAVSPWYVFMAMNLMTHTVSLTFALVAAVAIIRARRDGRTLWGLVAGAALGAGLLVRPLDGLIVAGLIALWAIGVGGRRLPLSTLVALAVGTVVVGGLSLPYNLHLTGDARAFPIMVYTDRFFGPNSNAYGFGADRGMGWALDPYPGHGPLDAFVNASLNVVGLNVELLGWSTGSLLPLAFLVARGRFTGGDWRMLALLAAVFGAFFFYYFSGGPDFGARYWFLMLPACIALTVRGLEGFATSLGGPGRSSQAGTSAVGAAVLCLSLLALVNFVPWRAIDKYYRYLNMRPDVRYLAHRVNFGRSLVLVRGNMHPDYASAAIYNPLDLQASAPIYAWDRNAETRVAVLRAYRDRPVWVLDGPTLTRAGYGVARGPVSADELLAEPRQGPEHPPSRLR
jgi:hypothetical protein